ncbi:NUDIX hydrolase [Roseateles koreensis]|uniref:NUDIX domain-containing protein n=1 Tax=Roseateles koreensis TaxID=2987526 RepID=A0ABT5KUW1_9BURK|nr:NUDIX domain-containing protein [Roseateles koreensis]MDC8786235.1 NUDIX domain-containing protein [Roseateles koreensis]
MPFVRIELAVMSVLNDALHVLLIKREQAPYAGSWALPGGVLRIDIDKDLEAAAQRVAQERLGVSLPYLRQQCAEGSAIRDPRAPWALSVVYRALVPLGSFEAEPGKRVEALKWVPVEEAMADQTLAFDHAQLIDQAVASTRAEVQNLQLPAGYLPAEFTLGELQSMCEALLGRRLDKSSFRRRLDDAGVVSEVPGAMRTGAFRPAQLHRLRAMEA